MVLLFKVEHAPGTMKRLVETQMNSTSRKSGADMENVYFLYILGDVNKWSSFLTTLEIKIVNIASSSSWSISNLTQEVKPTNQDWAVYHRFCYVAPIGRSVWMILCGIELDFHFVE